MQQLLELRKCIKLTCTDYALFNKAYQYSLCVVLVGENTNKYVVHKTKNDIEKFHQSTAKFIFQLDPPFDKKYINTEDPTATVSMINIYLHQIQQRLDCLTSHHLINFLQFTHHFPPNFTNLLTKQYVDQLTNLYQIDINLKNEQVVDIAWQSKCKILFVVSQCKKITKIHNLFKLFISNDNIINGSLQMIMFNQENNQWIKLNSQLIQAQPLSLLWDIRNSTLIVSTSIGIYIHILSNISGIQQPKLNLIDFIELPGIVTLVNDVQLATVYVLSRGINYQSKSRLMVYSIKKEAVVQVPVKLVNATAMVFEKMHRRLYVSDQEGIKIFKVENDSQKVLQNLSKIHTIKTESTTFDQLTLSSQQKPQYLFGYNKRGFITVFEIKSPQKQFLMSVLTNIECPQNWTSIERIWSKKLFCVNYNTNIVFISMKNQPIFVKENGITAEKIQKIIFDQQNQRLMYCDKNKLKICQIQL